MGEKRGAFSTASKPSSASVALATYWGSAQGLARLTATTVCAVAGAWLGFHVTSGGFGLLAPAARDHRRDGRANLIVLMLDIRAAREPVAAAAPATAAA